jgi:hypothetical protein
MTPPRDDASSLGLALDAFLQEYRRCGDLDGGVDGGADVDGVRLRGRDRASGQAG